MRNSATTANGDQATGELAAPETQGDEGFGPPGTRRHFLATGAAAAVGMAIVACGGSSGGGSGGSAASTSGQSFPGGPVKRGGRLRIAGVGGGTAETLNPFHAGYTDIDIARQTCLYDSLVTKPDKSGEVHMQLAESMEPNADGTEWTIRVREGVEFHDGSPLTADDVLFTLRYIANPKNAAVPGYLAKFWDLKNAKKLDDRTIRLPLTRAVADLPATISGTGFGVVKAGTTSFDKPNGTGPWKFVSWVPGQHSLFERNPNYYEDGLPYLDELELFSIPDQTARLNAVLAGEVDGAGRMPYAQAKAYVDQGSKSPVSVNVNQGFPQVYINMRTDLKPFDDVRVRQALRLIVDRQAMIDSVQSGFGEVMNDLWGKGYPHYNADIPQRTQDIEQAKSLLKQAGQENLTVTLTTAGIAAGQVEAATLLSQQAQAAGVTIKIRKVPAESYYTTGWPYPFGQSEYEPVTLARFYGATMLPGAPFPDTAWKDEKSLALLTDALGTVDPAAAQDKWDAFQQIMWETGATIHWGGSPYIDLASKKVHAKPAQSAFEDWGNFDLHRYWLA